MHEWENGQEGSTYSIGRYRTREVRVVVLPLVVGVEVLAPVIGIAVVVRIAHAMVGRAHIANVILMIVPLVVVIAIAIPITIARAPLVVAIAIAIAIGVIIVVGTVISTTSIALMLSGSFGHETCVAVAVVSAPSILLV